MGLFSRGTTRKKKTSEASNKSSSADLLQDSLDSLAILLRATGRHAFALDDDDLERFKGDCEAWARHVLTGAPVADPGQDGEATGAAFEAVRRWAELRHFYRDRRRAEERFVDDRLGKFKNVIWDLVEGLRAIAMEGRSAESTIEGSLGSLEQAVEGGSLETLREVVSGTVKEIRGTLQKQRDQFDTQLLTMGKQLAMMREDLLEARRQMELDPLTQIYNRRAFDSALEHYMSIGTLSAQPLMLMMVDLDHFKQINDRYGHPAGDQVLVKTARSIVCTFPRKGDFVARYGGEEFVVILFDVAAADGPRLADRLLDRVRRHAVEVDGREIKVTCSVGYAFMGPEDTTETLVSRADAALYAAKEGGRDRASAAAT